MKKAQTGIEFIVIYGGIFFFFVGFISLINYSIEKKNYEKKDIALSIEAEYLADEIALAHEAGPGYERTFTLPQTVLGSNYKIEIIENDSIYVYTTYQNVPDNKHAMSISCLATTYRPKPVPLPDPTPNRYIIDIKGPNTIRNVGGQVNISNSMNN